MMSCRQILLYHVCVFMLAMHAGVAKANVDPEVLKKIAELKVQLKTDEVDTAQVETIRELASLYMGVDRDTAQYYVNRGLILAEKAGFQDAVGNLHSIRGNIHAGRSDFEAAYDDYQVALDIFTDQEMPKGQARMYLNLGNIYEIYGDYKLALDYTLRGLQIVDSVDYAFLRPQYHNNLGNLYYDIGDFEKSMQYFELAEQSTISSGRTDLIPHIKLALSGVAEMQGDTGRAYELARDIIEMIDTIPNAVDLIPSAYRRMGDLAFAQKSYADAAQYYLKVIEALSDIRTGELHPQSIVELRGLVGLGKSYLALNDLPAATGYFNRAYRLADSTNQLVEFGQSAKGLAEVYERRGDAASALRYFKIYQTAEDSILNQDMVRRTTQLTMEHSFEMKRREAKREAELLAAKQRRKEIAYIVALGIALLVVTVLFLLFRLQSLRASKAKAVEEKLQRDLDYRNRELATNVLYTLKKNELLLDVSDKLKTVRRGNKAEISAAINDVIQEIYNNSKDIGWDEFELRFKEVHTDFYNKLTEKYSNLTPNEMRLCAFIKLNMTTKEISTITFQSEHSIVMARSRLKKKLGVDDERLSSFLHQV